MSKTLFGYSTFAVRVVLAMVVVASLAQGQTTSPTAVDRVLVLKHARVLQLLHGGRIVKEYKVALGGSPLGPKTQQGDRKTPEGVYVLDSRNPQSHYYKSLHISYPNQEQRNAAKRKGVSAGGNVFLHGLPNGMGAVGAAHRLHDWTDGCIAVTDEEIDEIWRSVPNATPIEIRP